MGSGLCNVLASSDAYLIVCEVDAVKLVAAGSQVFDEGDLVPCPRVRENVFFLNMRRNVSTSFCRTSEVKFSVFDGVSALSGALDQINGQLDHDESLCCPRSHWLFRSGGLSTMIGRRQSARFC